MHLIRREKVRGHTDYFANRESPLFQALCELVDKAEGLHGKLRRMLSQLSTECVFLYGSEANGTARENSDLDILVIGSCTLLELSEALLPATDLTNREINPILFSADAFRKKYLAGDHFLRNVLQSPKIFLRGGPHDLTKLVG